MRTLAALVSLCFLFSAEAHQGRPRGKNHPHNHHHQTRDCHDTFVVRTQSDLADYEGLRSQSGVDRNLHINTDITVTDLRIATDCEIKIKNQVKITATNVLALFAKKIDFGNKVELQSADLYVKTAKKIKLDEHLEITAQRMLVESDEEIKFKNKSILAADIGIFNAPSCDVKPHATRLVTQELGTCFSKAPFYVKLEVNPLAGDAPLNVIFDASKSFGLIDKFVYHFGNSDNLETTSEGAAYTYVTPGSFSARLEVQGTFGSLYSPAQSVQVNAPPIVNAEIHHEILRVNPPGVIFSTKEVPALENLKEFLWDFGDGSSLVVPYALSPVGFMYHDYAIENDYTVRLRLKDQANVVTPPIEKVISTFVDSLPSPRYSISSFKGEAPFTVDIQALETVDDAGQPLRYKWFFSDTMETISLGATRQVQHTFTQSGIYQVQLTVMDALNGSRTTIIPIYVGQANALASLPPLALIDSTDRFGEAPLNVGLSAARSFDPDGMPGQTMTYRWSFFDFGRNQNVVFFGQNFSYTFIKPGTIQVVLTVTDVTGQQTVSTVPIFVSGVAATPGGFNVLTTATPLRYAFNVNPFLLENSYSYESLQWDFGDGTYATVPGVEHTFPGAGNYIVTLRIRKLDGAYETYTQDLMVTATPTPQTASFTTNGNRYNLGEAKTFTAATSNPADLGTTRFTWHFGDGQSVSGIGSAFSAVSHIYSAPGAYRVTLHAQFATGLANFFQTIITANTPPILGELKIYGLPASAPATLGFAPHETATDSDGFIQSYVYEFGDGSAPINSTQGYLEHRYEVAGTYSVKITAIDNNGGRSSRTTVINLAANQAPIASIKLYLPPNLVAPMRIGFAAHEQSTDADGYINQYEYDFGDGVITATSEGYLEHDYVTAGSYRLGLRVRDDKGLWSEKVFYDLAISPNQAPIARMSVDVFDGTAPGRVGVEVWRMSSDADGFITEYEFDFGDGTIFNDNDGYEQHSYAVAGSYTIKVRVKDDKGLWSLPVEQTIAILEGQKPIAINTIFSADAYAPARVLMSAFDASYDVDGLITDVEYVFGDGQSAQVPIAQAFVEHTYLLAGNYIIQTRVRDNDGQWSEFSANSIEVRQSVAPVIGEIPVYGDRNRPAPNTFGFAPHEVTTSGHHPLNYVFDFGDGTVIDNAGNGYLEHTFQNPGLYTVTITVKDNRNQSTSKSVQVTVRENQPPTLLGLNIFGNFNEPAPVPVRFDMFGQIVEEYGQVASILYEFGDGNSATSFAQVEHTYESPGTYLVVVTVTDDQGAIARISRQVTINANQPPVALALKVFKGDSPLAPVSVGVAAHESFQDMDGFIASYIYDFGDGRIETTANGYLEHTYTSPGSYIIKVTAFDNKGAAVDSSLGINVRTNASPVAGFVLPKLSVIAYEVFTLDAVTGSSDPDGDQLTYSWDFGNGQNSSFEYPSHYYSNAGSYSIKLTVRDSFGETSEVQQIIEVTESSTSLPVPQINLESYPTGELRASAEGSFTTDGSALSYHWDLGDGTTSRLKVASHEYSEAGTYIVRLTVSKESGPSQSLTRSVTFAEPLASKSEFSPGDIEFIDGFVPNQFNPISKVLSLQVTEGVGVSGDLALSLNGAEIALQNIEGETDQFTAQIISREGLNTIEVLGSDAQGRALEKRIEYYAGSRSVVVNLQNPQGQPIAGVGLDIILPALNGATQKTFSYAPAQSSSLIISNVPSENLILKSSSGPFIIERLGRDQTEIIAKEIPWQSPSETPNDDFSAGVDGWRLKGSAQILTYPDGKKSLRVLATGNYAEISKTIAAGEEDLAILSVLKANSQDDDLIVLSARTEVENLEFKTFRAKDLKLKLQSGWRFSLPLNPNESNEVTVRIYPNTIVTGGSFWQFLKAFAQGEPASIELPPLIRTILNVNIPLIGYSRINPPDDQDKGKNDELITASGALSAFSIGPDFRCPQGSNRLFAGLVGGTLTTSGLYQPSVGDEIQLPGSGFTACSNFIHVNPNAEVRLAPSKEIKIAGLLITQANQARALARPTVTALNSISSQIQMLNSKLGNRPLFVLSEPGGLTEDGGAVDLEVVFYRGETQEFSANEINCQDTDAFLCFNVASNLPVLVSTNNLEDSGFLHSRYDGTRSGQGGRNLRFQTLYGGDHWAHPTLAKFLRGLKKTIEIGDGSRANGGIFNPHSGHKVGLEIDFKTPSHGYNRRSYQDFWKRLEDLREILPEDDIDEAGQNSGFGIEEIGFSISKLNSLDTDGVKSVDAKKFLEARCIDNMPVLAKYYSDHETHWHLKLKPEKVVREQISTTLSFESISESGGMYSNTFTINDSLDGNSVLDVVRIQSDGSRELVWASSNLNNSIATNDFDIEKFKVQLDGNTLTVSVRSELVEEVARSHEFIVSQRLGESCKEHVLKLRVNGCENASKGWPAELGYFLKSGAFVSDASQVHEGAIITQGVNVCGDSDIGDNVVLAGNLRVESSSIRTKDSTSFYDGNLSSVSDPSLIKASQINSNVSSFNNFEVKNTDIIGENSTTAIINRSQLTGANPSGNRVFGRAEFIDATVQDSVVSGGTAQVPSQAYLRIVGTVDHAKAWGYGYIQGVLMNGATFDGAYYETIDGTRTSHIGDTGVVRDPGTKYRGINWARGLMELGCNTDTLNGSYMEIGTVCTAGGSMRGVSRLEAGILFGALNNQTMRLRNGQFEIVDSNTANGVPLSPIYTSPEPGDLP